MPLAGAAPVEADRELIARLLEELKVERELPVNSLTEYAQLLLERLLQMLPSPISGLAWLTPGRVAAIAIGLVALALGSLAWALLRTRAVAPAAAPRAPSGVATEPPAAAAPADWAAEFEARLAGGDARAGLEALWHLLLQALGAQGWPGGTTLRELLRRTGRHDLLPWAARLERLSYGPRHPQAADVRGLRDRLEAHLA